MALKNRFIVLHWAFLVNQVMHSPYDLVHRGRACLPIPYLLMCKYINLNWVGKIDSPCVGDIAACHWVGKIVFHPYMYITFWYLYLIDMTLVRKMGGGMV